ncbi:phage tail tape measure protein [Streptomyces sp. NPDC093060]|uniref:phage tail tape measure protein n=1 Tax=Streptomyces sp. NPDC093060 TaxID=3366019 RepID=UPI0037F84985
MAVRTVTVRLRADVNQYTRSLRQASDNTSKLAGIGAKAGAVLVTGFAIAVAAAAKFDKAMSNVRSVTNGSAAQMAKLRAAALDAGKTTAYSATQAADAEAELARAGVSVADITGGALKGSLALAAAGQMDLADAATISAQAMNTFGLHGKDVTHIADVLASGANKSAADMNGLGMSLRQGGLLAHQTGLSLEDTVGTLAAFADHALIGSDAGTSLKVMLQRLTPQSDEARSMMERLGFTAYDSQGKFVGLTKLAGNLQKSFSNLTPEARNAAFATIFGSDAVRSATILYELGAKGIQRYVSEVNDSGAAARTAAIQTDNLAGDFERLKGALEVALIEGGSSANGALRGMVQWVTRLVNAYNSLPPSVQKAVTLTTGIGGATMIAAAGFLLLLPRIAATRAALTQLGVTAARTRVILNGLGRAGLVLATLEAMAYGADKLKMAFEDAPPNVTKLGNSLLTFAKTGKAAGELTKQFGKDLDGFGDAAARLAHPGVLDRVGDSLYNITHLGSDSQPLDEARNKIKAVDEALKSLVEGGAPDVAANAFNRLAKEAEAQGTSTEKLRTLLPGYEEALVSTDTQTKLSADAQAKLGEQVGLTADQVQDQRSEAEKLSDALKTLNGASIDAAEQEIQFRQSLQDLNDAVKENGHSLDVSSEKGRKVKGAFLDAAKAAMEHAQAVAEQQNSQEAGQAVLDEDISLLKQQMKAAHFSQDAIDKLTAAYLRLPKSATTKIDAKTQGAMNDLQMVQNKVKATKGKTITVDTLTAEGQKALEALGYKIQRTKGKTIVITVPTGTQQANVNALGRAIAGLHSKSVTVTTYMRTVKLGGSGPYRGKEVPAAAHGGLIRRYAAGGDVVQAIPFGGPVFGPGTGTSDSIPALVSNGEYVIKADAVRKYGLAMFDRLNAGRYASGGLAGFTYTPTGRPVLGGPGDAKQRYDQEIADLKKAWDDLTKSLKAQAKAAKNLKDAEKHLSDVRKHHHTRAQLRAAEERVDKARSAKKAADTQVSKDRKKVNEADEELGLKHGSKAPKHFNLKAYETQLNESLAATEKWRKNLDKVGKRGGTELQKMLEGMGEDGQDLVNALAGASDKEFKRITEKLKKTGDLAKATLKDFTKQLDSSTQKNQQFAADLQKLAAQGFGDLAQALAAQGDDSAMELAHQAAGDKKAAGKAEKSVDKAQGTLSGEDLSNSLILLSTLRGGTGRGYADLIAAGLGPDVIKALVPKMTKQIAALPEANKATFVKQWVAQGGQPMALGGILTRPTMVLGAEAGVPESWIPWTTSARSRALLARTATAMGYQLTPAGRYATSTVAATAMAREMTRQIIINLYGAKQSSAEQAMDIARHMSFVG